MLFLRIKQAEVALADGRLDEAYDLVQSQGLREHRRGQALVTRLVAALVGRGKAHVMAERFQQALADCEKAGKLGGNVPDIAEVRSAAAAALAARERAEREAARALAAARRHVEDGHLTIGERLLAPLREHPKDQVSRVAILMEDVAAKRELLEAALTAAGDAVRADDAERAVAAVARARATGADGPRLDAVAAETGRLLRRRINDAIAQGRLDVADALGRLAATLGGRDVEAEQLQRTLAQYRLAWELVDAGNAGKLRQAEEVLRRLSSISPDAPWAADTLRQLRQAYEAIEALRTGPLGLLAGNLGSLMDTQSMPPRAAPNTPAAAVVPPPVTPARAPGTPPPLPGTPGAAAAVPSKFMIRVDGVGSFLVLRQAKVSIGPVSSSRLPDVGLVADPSLPVIDVERLDDDYFVRSPAAVVAVNDRSAVGNGPRLLAGGDRIALSPRCRMVFRLPSPASTSAVLELTGCRTPSADVRRVVLMDRDLIIGPGAGAHIQGNAYGDAAGGLDAPVVLHLRGGRLCCEAKAEVTVDGRPMDRHIGIPVGGHVRVGSLSFVIGAA